MKIVHLVAGGAVVVAVVVIAYLVTSWNRQDRLESFKVAEAASAASNCHLSSAAVTQLVVQFRERRTVGWAESGQTVAQRLTKDCDRSPAATLPKVQPNA